MKYILASLLVAFSFAAQAEMTSDASVGYQASSSSKTFDASQVLERRAHKRAGRKSRK